MFKLRQAFLITAHSVYTSVDNAKIVQFVMELFCIQSRNAFFFSFRACVVLSSGTSSYSCQGTSAVFVSQLVSGHRFMEHLGQSSAWHWKVGSLALVNRSGSLQVKLKRATDAMKESHELKTTAAIIKGSDSIRLHRMVSSDRCEGEETK